MGEGSVGWGLIGASTIARQFMVPAIRSQADARPVAVLSSRKERGERFAEENGISRSYDSIEAFLDDPEIDVVYISTTSELHKEHTLAAAAAGKAVLCEKPLALTLDDALEMIDFCREAGVLLATNHHLRNAATHRALRGLVEKGAIGEPLAARVFHAVYLPDNLHGWRIESKDRGGGVILDITVHDADTLRFVLGDEVAEVVAISGRHGLSSGDLEDTVMGVMRFRSGVLASFHDAFTVRHAGTGLEVHGTEGSLVARDVMTQLPMGEVFLRRGDRVEEVDVGEREDLYVRSVSRFNAALRGEGEPAATGEDGLRSLAIALAVEESAASGRRRVVRKFSNVRRSMVGDARRVEMVSAKEAAAKIPNGAVVSVSSSSGLGCPDAVLKGIGERFAAEGEPYGLTTLHPIAAGDMFGIEGMNHLARPGLLQRIIAGSYPSGPSSAAPPRIWQMIGEGEVEAYNLPSGILYQMHREAAAGNPGVLTKVGIDTFVDPRRSGGRMNEATTEEVVRVVEFDGDEWLYFPSIGVDVAIIRGTTADELGNISMEDEGAYLGVLDQALAARNNGGVVIAQVKQVAEADSLSPREVRVPGVLVDYVVVAPEQMQTTQTFFDPAISGKVRRPLKSFEPLEWAVDKVIARRVAQELHRGEVVNLGFGISALVPRVLLEEGLQDEVVWVIEQGPVGGVPLIDFQFGCAVNAQAIMPSPDQFTYFQGGGFDRSLLSFLQVDQSGNVNVSRLAAKPHVTAGVGGFIDITARAKNLVFGGFFTAGGLRLDLDEGGVSIVQEGRTRKFVPDVEQVTFSGREARTKGQDVTYVTERCVMKLSQDGLVVTEVAPGIDLKRDVLGQADLPLRISPDLRLMDERLFRREPVGLTLPSLSDGRGGREGAGIHAG